MTQRYQQVLGHSLLTRGMVHFFKNKQAETFVDSKAVRSKKSCTVFLLHIASHTNLQQVLSALLLKYIQKLTTHHCDLSHSGPVNPSFFTRPTSIIPNRSPCFRACPLQSLLSPTARLILLVRSCHSLAQKLLMPSCLRKKLLTVVHKAL